MPFNPDGLKLRQEIALLCDAKGLVSGAEIGVDAGTFSATLLRSSQKIRLYCVDPWLPYAEIPKPRDDSKAMAVKTLAKFGDRATIVPHTSLQASLLIREPLDFVYIDGAHDGPSVTTDLYVWYKQLRPGGLLAGHDFDLPGVADSVLRFAYWLGVTLHIIPDIGDAERKDETGAWAHPSYYLFKPEQAS